MTETRTRRANAPSPPRGAGRLLGAMAPQGGPAPLAEHLNRWGLPPLASGRGRAGLIGELDRSGLRGRGGAWFPTAVKWRAVASRRLRRPVVVANCAEGEPASYKDGLLLSRAPHLVLDGASLAAAAVGASRLVIYVSRQLAREVATSVAERAPFGLDSIEPEVVIAADGFAAGESSAVVAHLNGGPGGVPAFTGLRPVHERGVGGRPTLVQNAETLAHAALIARFGAAWFRRLGTTESPGTALASVSGAVSPPRVTEVALGSTLREVVETLDVPVDSLQAVLMGGYGGAWLSAPHALDAQLCEERLGPLGASFGAGVIALLPTGICPLAETARIVRYMESQGAGQCGPCTHGLPAMTSAMTSLATDPSPKARCSARLAQLCDLIDRRGACHHPDGVARLVRSTLRVFAHHVDAHQRHGPCSDAHEAGVLAVPGSPRRDPAIRSSRSA